MSQLFIDISISLDGYAAGPDQSLDDPLGVGGHQLHEWVVGLEAWRSAHGLEGGAVNEASALVDEVVGRTGATIMGRRMFSGGSGAWADDANANGWWGDEPPFHHPVFVLTHHAREPLELTGTTFTFVTDGIESALAQARAAAGERDVHVAGGADVARQYLAAGVVDELGLHVAPVLLGGGERLLDGLPARLERTRAVTTPDGAVHLRYRVSAPATPPAG
jgi:dihydrofolate reductase